MFYIPLEPNPFIPRFVSGIVTHSSKMGYDIFSHINCAILSPLLTLNISLLKLNKITPTFPV